MSLQTNPPSSQVASSSLATSRAKVAKSPGAQSRSIFVTSTRPILVILGVLIAVAVIGAIVSNQKAKTATEARDAFYSAKQALDLESKALTPPKAAEPEATGKNAKKKTEAPPAQDTAAYKKVDVDQAFSKTIPALRKVIALYPGTLSAFEAQMTIGNLYADHGQTGNAIQPYTTAADMAPRALEKMAALAALAQAQENVGKCPDALQSLERAINLGVGALKGDLLVAKARCYETLGNSAQAKTTYDQILKDLPGTPFARLAEIYRAKIQ